MILSLVLATSSAHAFSYTTETVARLGRGSSLTNAVVSASGDVCYSTYSGRGSLTRHWSSGAGNQVIGSSSDVGSYQYCYGQSNTGYALVYEYAGATASGYIYDELTDEAHALTSDGSYSAYGYFLNDNGYSVGYSVNADYTYDTAVWGPDGGDGTVLAFDGDYGYATALDGQNRVILYGYSSTRFGTTTNVAAYDADRGTYQDFPAAEPLNSSPLVTEDGDVLVVPSASGPVLDWDLNSDSLAVVDSGPATYRYLMASNAAGDLVFTGYDASYVSHLTCWSRGGGEVELDTAGGAYNYAGSINDSGQVGGYVYAADGLSYSPALWDCGTGELTTLTNPSGYDYAYIFGLTESGLAIVMASSSTGAYGLFGYDTSTGEYAAIYEFGTSSYGQLLNVNQETGDLLLYVYTYSGSSYTGRLQYLSYGG